MISFGSDLSSEVEATSFSGEELTVLLRTLLGGQMTSTVDSVCSLGCSTSGAEATSIFVMTSSGVEEVSSHGTDTIG